jgi:diguanylate cyclase (GGDEF)-like protein
MLENGKVVHLAVTRDITERKKMEREIRQLAFYDDLTKLPNRRLLDDRLGQAMSASKRTGFYGAVIFLDLDNFKPLNDTHGHEVGDLLLIEAAFRLRGCIRGMDTVARFGGDEFVVVLSELDTDKSRSAEQARIVAEKIRSALSAPYRLTIRHRGRPDIMVEHHCTVSMGVVLFVNHECNQTDILKSADVAMYQAKESGRNNIKFFEPELKPGQE